MAVRVTTDFGGRREMDAGRTVQRSLRLAGIPEAARHGRRRKYIPFADLQFSVGTI